MNLCPTPQISVVMPVHNARPFLDQSIRSILEQTMGNFEFVIFDDASTDGSTELLREWARRDGRIRLHEGTQKLGLAGSSNAVVSKAQAPIIARMDADDVAHPDRFRLQWEVLETRPEVAVVGTLCNGIDTSGREVRPRDRWRLLRRSTLIPFPHGSVMFRRNVFDQVGGYDKKSEGGEDQDLFLRMARQGSVLTLPEVLYSYRYHANNATLANGARGISQNHSQNGHTMAAFYMLGAMRLWAGNPPQLLQPLLARKSLNWNPKTMLILAAALWGHVSPHTLRLFLRLSIRARDLLASARVKDGRPYEWRTE